MVKIIINWLVIKLSVFFYRNGYFYSVYDLSTSGNSASNYLIPSVRVGNLRVSVTFNRALDIDLTMLVYLEFPSTLFLVGYILKLLRMS